MPLWRVGEMIFGFGVIIVATAYFWCKAFYKQVADVVGFKGPLPDECLYQLNGPCRAPAAVANFLGGHAYEPLLFWAGAVVTAVGALLVVLGYGTRRPPRWDRVAADFPEPEQFVPPSVDRRIEPNF